MRAIVICEIKPSNFQNRDVHDLEITVEYQGKQSHIRKMYELSLIKNTFEHMLKHCGYEMIELLSQEVKDDR